MNRWIAVAAAVAGLAGCGGTTDKPALPPTPPPAVACEVPALVAGMGSAQPDFAPCGVPTLVTALGKDVRQAKAQCRAFIALDGDWKQHIANWGRLLTTVMDKAQAAGGPSDGVASDAKVVRDIAAPMAGSSTLRDLSLNNLVLSVTSLEAKAGVPSTPNPDCQP